MKKHLKYIERQRPLWLRIIASLLYTASLGLIIFFITTMEFSIENGYWNAHFDLLQFVFLFTFLAVYFSYTINCYFDFEKKRFKREKTIGVFRVGKWKSLPKLDYVSIFGINEGTFQVNLFHSRNKHWDLYEKFDFKNAFIIAFELSEKLDVDLLDATVPGKYKWVDKEATKKAQEIVYFD